MRFKIQIEDQYQTHQDKYGQPFFAWRRVCDCWASWAKDGLIIKPDPKIKKGQRAIGAGRVMTIGAIKEIEDGGIKFLSLQIVSSRGDYENARERKAPKPTGLPETHNEHGDESKWEQ